MDFLDLAMYKGDVLVLSKFTQDNSVSAKNQQEAAESRAQLYH